MPSYRSILTRANDRVCVRNHLESGRGLTRKDAWLRYGITPQRLDRAIDRLRTEGMKINRIKGDRGEWVYVGHDKELFENLENSEEQ